MGLTLTDVDHAIARDRSIVRTWLMRGTLHLAAADDLRPMLALLGPIFASGNRRRHAQLGLDEETKRRGSTAIASILADAGPLTRHQLVDRLRQRGIALDPRTQAPIHLIAFAAMHGICCLGPSTKHGESTFVLLDDWIPRQQTSPLSLGELAARYFAAFGPASLVDFAWWSGLPMTAAREGVEAARRSLAEARVRGEAVLLPRDRLRDHAADADEQAVRLLPAFDTYLLGYRSRDLAIPPALQRRLQRGGGWIHPVVVVDGRAVAAWVLRKTGSRRTVVIEGMGSAGAGIRRALDAETRDIGQFLDAPVGLTLDDPAVKSSPR